MLTLQQGTETYQRKPGNTHGARQDRNSGNRRTGSKGNNAACWRQVPDTELKSDLDLERCLEVHRAEKVARQVGTGLNFKKREWDACAKSQSQLMPRAFPVGVGTSGVGTEISGHEGPKACLGLYWGLGSTSNLFIKPL